MSGDTVGSLLAEIANFITDGLRALNGTDKAQWGPDEHEQRRRLELTLDEAKKDFQELAPLVHGQRYYMSDRIFDSLHELRTLRTNFAFHATNLRDWARQGGPINPIWAVETTSLRHELHRAQCRAAGRIFAAEQEAVYPRCLGAFIVYRKQRAWAARLARRRKQRERQRLEQQRQEEADGRASPQPPSTPTLPYRHKRQGSSLVPSDDHEADDAADDEYEQHRHNLAELAACNSVGKFERFGDRDIAFVCDFCDGHIVWEDLEAMPSIRTADEETATAATAGVVGAVGAAEPLADATATSTSTATSKPATGLSTEATTPVSDTDVTPPPLGSARPGPDSTSAAGPIPGVTHWQATGFRATTHEEKSVVFAPLAIANHVAPARRGDWVARLRCPACEEPPPDYTPPEGEEEDEGGGAWSAPAEDDIVFEDLAGLQEHLEWWHAPPAAVSGTGAGASWPSAPQGCGVM